jgi:4-diphosphocytidyl-2C-methyl-D-erythritol kinase
MPMPLEKKSPCKVNLLLNILGKRPDGFHELETVMQPVDFCDELAFERGGNGDSTHLQRQRPAGEFKKPGLPRG